MHLRIGTTFLAALLSLSPMAFGAAHKSDKASITFHLQADQGDDPKMTFPMNICGKQFIFGRVPEFRLHDMASFRPFPANKDEMTYGVVIYLKPYAGRRLSMITNANRGKFLVAQVNGRVVDEVIINDQVNDGILVIWKNLTLADIKTLKKALPLAKDSDKAKKE